METGVDPMNYVKPQCDLFLPALTCPALPHGNLSLMQVKIGGD